MVTSDHKAEIKWEEKKMNTKMMSKKMNKERRRTMKDHKVIVIAKGLFIAALLFLACSAIPSNSGAEPLPGGSLDPTTIPKYVIPLVIPPVMNTAKDPNGIPIPNKYDIAVRQFQQQILPGGIWDAVADPDGIYPNFDPTTVWSYGPAADTTPAIAPATDSQFNYPAYTIETVPTNPYGNGSPVNVRWINELVMNPDDCFNNDGTINPAAAAGSCDYRPHLLPVDQTLHWANPPAIGCRDGSNRTDCATNNPDFYTGPVPIVTHLHGAHVDWHSDGYPESWWLPNASNIPSGYATSGGLFDDATGGNPGTLGYADYLYRNDQPATTLWYHDHSLGMTRLNVYAGPAGFWLVRGGVYDKPKDTLTNMPAVLPGPAPVAGDTVVELNVPSLGPAGTIDKRKLIREIPIVIQDRSFNEDGSLFYPDNRAFFEGLNFEGTAETVDAQFPGEPELQIPFVPDPDSDIAPIWNPEAFFNVMVVNGVAWPNLDVAPAKYRFRLLNGCDSRFLNLSMFVVNGDGTLGAEIPFYQIGAEQGYLPNVVRIETGFATVLPANGTMPALTPAADPAQALLVALAERADVIVDFSGLADGTKVRMINTGPDAPFNGTFDPDEKADPDTTGQVMEFTVSSGLSLPTDALTTNPLNLKPKNEPMNNKKIMVTRQVSLNEGESELLCVVEDPLGNVTPAFNSLDEPVLPTSLDPNTNEPCYDLTDMMVIGEPFAPKEALLGTVQFDPLGNLVGGIPLKWTDNTINSTPATVTMANGSTVDIRVSENPTQGDTEIWEIYNFTMDAHPIHLHLVRFEVVDREIFNPDVSPKAGLGVTVFPPEPWETGFKDTVIAYPGEITRVKAEFDIAGLYVWHCHILEHEDNEMMRPYVVSPKPMGRRP